MESELSGIFRVKLVTKNIVRRSPGTQFMHMRVKYFLKNLVTHAKTSTTTKKKYLLLNFLAKAKKSSIICSQLLKIFANINFPFFSEWALSTIFKIKSFIFQMQLIKEVFLLILVFQQMLWQVGEESLSLSLFASFYFLLLLFVCLLFCIFTCFYIY